MKENLFEKVKSSTRYEIKNKTEQNTTQHKSFRGRFYRVRKHSWLGLSHPVERTLWVAQLAPKGSRRGLGSQGGAGTVLPKC